MITKFSLVSLCTAWFAISGFAYAETNVPSEIKIQNTVCTTGTDEKFGEINCDNLKKEAGGFLKGSARHVIASYHDDGVILQFSSKNGFCKTISDTNNTVVEVKHPFCNIMDGETGAGCGDYCKFSKKGFEGSSSCKAENSYFLGSRVEIWKKAYEEVAAELENGTIKVHSIGNARPCGAYAKAIVAVIDGDKESAPPKAGLRDVRTALSKRFAPTESRIHSSELSKSCLGDQGEMMDHTDIGDKTLMTQHRSIAFCHLVSAHVRMRGLFHDLLRCEFSTRADEQFLDLSDQTFIMNPAMNLIEQCNDGGFIRHHEDRDRDGNVTRSWDQVDDEDGALGSFEGCYRRAIDGVIRQAIRSKIPVSKGDALKPYAKIKTKDGINFVEYPACSGEGPLNLSGLMLIPFLRRRKRGTPHVLTKLILLALVFTFTTAFGRKRDDHGTVDPKLCADGKTIERIDYAQRDGVERPGSSDPTSPYEQNKSECGTYYDKYYRGCAQKVFSWFCGRNKNWRRYQGCINGAVGQAIVNLRLAEACPCGGGGVRTECDKQTETIPKSDKLSKIPFDDLRNAEVLAVDSDVIMPPVTPDSGTSSSGTPSASAATEGGTFDKSETKHGKLADTAGGNMKAPKFDMASTKGEGTKGAAGASHMGEPATQAAKDEKKESALTEGVKPAEQIAYEAAKKEAGKQGSPFTGSKFGSDFDSAGKGAAGVDFSQDSAGAAAGGSGTGEEDPETYLARAGTGSLFDRVHPHFSRWGDQVQSGKWQSEFKRLGK